MIYSAGQKGPFKVSGYHDPDTIRTITVIFRPDTWGVGTVYQFIGSDNYSIVLPTVYTGYYHKAINTGKSNATTEPTWAVRAGEQTEDFEAGKTDGLVWEAVSYNLLPIGIDVSSVTYAATNGVTVSGTSNTTTQCQFTIDVIGSTAAARTIKKFSITVHVTLSDGDTIDATFEFKVAEK